MICVIKKNPIVYNIVLPDLADQYEFLMGKGDDTCRKNSQGGVLYLCYILIKAHRHEARLMHAVHTR